MIIEGPLTRATIASGPTRERQTQPTGATRFNDVLRRGGRVLLAAGQAALSTLPGGEVLCAAVRDGADAATGSEASRRSSGANPATPGGGEASNSSGEGNYDLRDITQQSQEFNLMYLQLQEELGRENRRFSALSNVLKTRHETARSVISNI